MAPQLAPGLELIGEYEDSGFKETPYLARRADGQVLQLPRLLYVLAEQIDGRRDYDEIAARVTRAFGRGLTGNGARYLAEEKLVPLGIVAVRGGTGPALQKVDPLLALRLRVGVVPETVVNRATRVFRPLFLPAVVVGVLSALVALDGWLFLVHGVATGARQVLYDPLLVLLLLGLIVLSAAFHECGHATACAYGGARPGGIGAGIYIVWPAFYTDVTDAYRLGRGGRLRTDLGGVYFNVIFILATAVAYFATGFEPLLLLILIQHLEIMHQFLPFIRLDGYYIVSDLTGVPDMFARIRPTLASLLPWRRADKRVRELKPAARAAVTVYVFATVPTLLFAFGIMVVNAPRIFATAYDSVLLHYDRIGREDALHAGISALQMAILILPAAGLAVSGLRGGKRALLGSWRRTDGRPAARALLVVGTAATTALLAWLWWPNGEYRPIQPGERGTLQGAIKQLRSLAGGRPALTPTRQRQLHGAPRRHELEPHLQHPGTRAPGAPPQQRPQPTPSAPAAGGDTVTTGRSASTSPVGPAPGVAPGVAPTIGTPPSPTLPGETFPATVGTTVSAITTQVSTPSATVSTPVATVSTPVATVSTPSATVPTPTVTPPTPTVGVTTGVTVTVPAKP